MKLKVFSLSMISLLTLSIGVVIFAGTINKNFDEAEAYTAASLPTTIDLNETTNDDIKSYYSDLVGADESDLKGTNLLYSLKPILKNGQKYYSYESGTNIWKMYEITDRDWDKSPAEDIPGYNSVTNIITGYQYKSSINTQNPGPYVHALYNNRNVDNQSYAWMSHGDRSDAWTIEREHVWPKSQGFEASGQGGARGDPMHLMAAEGSANGAHSNHAYGYVDKTKKYTDVGSTHSNATGNLTGKSKTDANATTVFEPQDSDKGDIARAIFYMAARYNYHDGDTDTDINTNNPNLELVDYASELASYTSSKTTTGKMGILSDLLEWNELDPPDEYEIHRNDLLYNNFTNNRNPFIDYPDWANHIWGSKKNIVVNPNTDPIHSFSGGGSHDPVAVTGVSLIETATVKVGESEVLSPDIAPNTATNKSVSWTTSDENIATVSNGRVTGVAVGNATITVTTQDGNFTATCEVTVIEDAATDNVDIINSEFINIGASYTGWSNKKGASGAIYAGYSYKGTSDCVQMNSTKSSGIVSSDSPGKISKVTLDWLETNSNSNKKVDIYGSNDAYTGASDLYSNLTSGTKVGTLTYGDASTELTIDGDYTYVGIRPADGALYLNSITFEWAIPVTSIEMDIDSLEFDLAGENSATLTATFTPSNATNTNIIWHTSDPNVVTVDENGVVTAVGVGEAEVIAVAEDGQYETYCNINVIDSSAPIIEDETTIDVTISSLALANSWSNDTAYGNTSISQLPISLDENISFQATGSAINGKYFSADKTWRLYYSGSGKITINASNDCTINEVTLIYSVKNNGTLKDSNSQTIESNVSNAVNASSVTYSTSAGTVMIKEIIVTYEGASQPVTPKVLSSISLSGTYPTEFEVGDEFSSEGIIVTAHFDDESTENATESASFSGYDMSIVGKYTITVSVEKNNITKTATYQITVKSVTSLTYINGLQYELSFTKGETKYYFTGSIANEYYGATSDNYDDGVYVYFEKNGNGQNIYFYTDKNNPTVENKRYLSIDAHGNYVDIEIGESVPSSIWKYDDTKKCIYYEINDGKYTMGASTKKYTTLTGFNLDDIDVSSDRKPVFADTAESLAYSIENYIICDATGNTTPTYDNDTSWSVFNDIYDTLGDQEQQRLKSAQPDQSGTLIERAMAKYDYIACKYHLTNFITSRTPQVFSNRFVSLEIEENKILLAVIIAGILSATSIGLYLYIKKKKIR